MDKKVASNFGIKILVEISRVILGVIFMFSGIVKAVDPWGTAYKIEDYLTAFGLSSFSFMSFPLSAGQSIVEFALGAFLLFGLYRFWTSRLILLIMCLMTPLTLYLAIENPVSDCGCFGDAIIISNWETFYKNIVLTICAVIVFIYYNRISNIFTGKTYWIAFLFISLFSVTFVIRNYIYEPIFDFRPYHVGANIPENMLIEEGNERVEESFLIYAKDGVEKEFTEDNFPWEDSTWVFVRMDSKVLKEGKDAKIDNFSITQLQFNNTKTEIQGQADITNQVLSDSTYTFLMISPSLQSLNADYLSSLEDVAYYSQEHDYNFYCLTASVTEDILKFVESNSVGFDFCTMDERILKTITRTNPGLVLLKDGVVVNKWADIEVPSEEDLQAPLEKLEISKIADIKSKDRQSRIYISIIFFLPLLLLKLFDLSVYSRRKKAEKEIN